MLTNLQTRLKRAGKWLPFLALPFAAQAQSLNYTTSGATNVAGTYTDLGTTGTAIATANTDDDNSAAQPIGFTFSYNGQSFTQFVLSTNGMIKLGATPPSATNLFLCNVAGCTTIDPVSSTNPADVNLIMPFNFDLMQGSSGGTEYRVATTGTAPNRVCTVQWKNVSDKSDASPVNTQYDNFSFQAKLYETTNNIEFVYGPTVPSTNVAVSRFPVVGIKGAGAGSGQTVLANKTTGAGAWTTTVFITGNYTGTTHNIRNVAPADLGRTYRFTPTTLLNNDVAVVSLFTLGKVSSTYGSPVEAKVVVTNAGTATQTSLPVTLTVSGATTYTNTQTVASLAPNASTTVTFTYPVTATSGTNTVTASVPNDDLATNNSKVYSQLVTTGNMSYIDASQPLNTAGVGVGVAQGVLATRFTLRTAGTVSSITPTFVGAGTPNTTYQVQLYDATGANGTPGAVLYTSAAQTRPGASGSPVIALPNVALPAGDFFVAIKELDNNVVLAYQVEDPLRPTTFYYQVPGGAWTLVNSTTLRTRLAIEVGLGTVCTPVQNLATTAVSSTSANLTFTGVTGATYTITYQAAGGPVQTVTPAPSASPVPLTGLTPNTTYTVTVVTNCTGGTTSTASTVTFTTQAPPAPYAVLPYSESFEGPWVNGLSTRDLPTVNWRNTPATGDNSWRREDDGFASAGWQFQSYETGTTPPYPIRFSTGAHSARFHTFGSALGQTGRLDLFVNMGTPGTKRLSFDYINPTGTDKLDVFVSTDGGATFGSSPVLTANTNATFTNKAVTISSTSATTVIRFQATSDFGDDDLGIDNLRVAVITGTQNEALAATVNLYPNPAHQSFKLVVPAGNLHTASASLINALGQVVQQRELNLPAAGGTAEFNVSGLAAGVYSLQLKTGNDLVVKRVVVE